MYQAVPQPVHPPGSAVQVVLVIDVPHDMTECAADALRLADEFGTTLSHWLPGVRAKKAVLSVPFEASEASGRSDVDPSPTGLMIDLANRRVSADGRPLRLAYREFALLAYLATVPHRTVSRSTLLHSVWSDHRPGQRPVSDRTVDTHIRRLRAKLDQHAHVLTTVRGHGYRFDPGTEVRIRGGVLRRLAN
ncbi:MAG: winged helix-turn-helix domain-containing protein [Mycobacterium sp.]